MFSSAFTTGFVLSATLIIAIGAQNAFILRQGLLRQHVFMLSLICALSDALLIAAGVAGLGTLIASSPRLLEIVPAHARLPVGAGVHRLQPPALGPIVEVSPPDLDVRGREQVLELGGVSPAVVVIGEDDTRVEGLRASRGLGSRHRDGISHRDERDVEGAAELCGPLSHVLQAKSARTSVASDVEADAVVFDAARHGSLRPLQGHRHMTGLGVAGNVGKSLLEDSSERELRGGRKRERSVHGLER